MGRRRRPTSIWKGSMDRIVHDAAHWVCSTTGQEVTRSTPLIGGLSSRVHACDLRDGSVVVLRHVIDAAWLAAEPELIRNEAAALTLLSESQIRAPKLVASNPKAGLLLMTHLSGTMRSSMAEIEASIDDMCDLAQSIASVELPEDHTLPDWKPWAPLALAPPTWGDARLWSHAIEVYRRRNQPLVAEPALLHRDLHPLNLLWSDGRVGVVDWVSACVGHPHAELGHARWNIAVLASQSAAEQFLDRYLAQTEPAGSPHVDIYDPWWDLAPLMSFTSGPLGVDAWHAVGRQDLSQTKVVAATERFLQAALDRL